MLQLVPSRYSAAEQAYRRTATYRRRRRAASRLAMFRLGVWAMITAAALCGAVLGAH